MKKIILIIVGIILLVSGFSYLLISVITEDTDIRIKHQQELDNEKFNNINCNLKVDSLNKINFELSKYKSLTQAMLHRDEATKQLKHKIGDVVILKNDSSRVVIEDVLIGGGKYNYYIKFRVLFKDNTTKEIVPELVY